MVPRPPTPALTHTSAADASEKKRKRGKTSEGSEEGEIPQPMQQPPTKESGVSKGTKGKQHSKAFIWNPAFVLSLGDPIMDDASFKDP